MHGPGVDPRNQPLVVIRQRATEEKFQLVLRILSCFESNFVHLTAEEHDRITADTQAVTHAAFLRYRKFLQIIDSRAFSAETHLKEQYGQCMES